MEEITCNKCGKKFKWELVGQIYPGGKDKEEIICPYCCEVNGYRMTSQSIHIEKSDY